jgi:hypothetical protein
MNSQRPIVSLDLKESAEFGRSNEHRAPAFQIPVGAHGRQPRRGVKVPVFVKRAPQEMAKTRKAFALVHGCAA